jgi:hypothetical protein
MMIGESRADGGIFGEKKARFITGLWNEMFSDIT